jgi:hypothetical protein
MTHLEDLEDQYVDWSMAAPTTGRRRHRWTQERDAAVLPQV